VRRFRHVSVIVILGLVASIGTASAQSDPPGRVGRLAYINGTVSFHDEAQTQWAPAMVNTPLTSGDSLWTEPNARSEVSISGTRVRMDGATQLDMLAIDDDQVRMQVPEGRLDIKAASMDKPYQIVTPRGTVALEQQGDYYIQAGSTQDPTRLGVRSGAAQITGLNGQTLAVRAGEIGEVTGESGAPVLRTIQDAPPPMQPYWADRDRQVSYDPPQYLPTSVTGYEDLGAYGTWSNQGDYGQVWTPSSVPVGWEPYHTGYWTYVQPWGWTWVDEQPWGFAPFHYGRWVNANSRWSWVPPAREAPAVYAPALVSFIGAAALAANQPSVGWFPLGPREVYVPPYTTNRDYFRNVNRANVRDQALIDARYQWAEQHRDAQRPPPNDPRFTRVNERFATVVPQQAFQRSQPVERAALKVAPEKFATAQIAPVAAPPIIAHTAEPAVRTRFADMETIGRPTEANGRSAPGPKFVKRADAPQPGGGKPETGPVRAIEAPPPLLPRTGAAPLEPRNEARGAPAPVEHPPLVRPEASQTRPEVPKLPPAKNKGEPQARPVEHSPVEHANEAKQPEGPANKNRAAVPHTQEPQRPGAPSSHPGAAPPPTASEPARPAAEPPRAAAEPPHPAAAPQQRPAEPSHAAAPPMPRPAEPPHVAAPPQQSQAPGPQRMAPPPQPQHMAPPPQQAHAPQPQHAAPPQQQHAAPPPQQAHAPAPPHPAPNGQEKK
jgi:hypothetical protein